LIILILRSSYVHERKMNVG